MIPSFLSRTDPPSLFTARLVLALALLGALACAEQAAAATVEITGPAGAEVLLDGAPVGFLPLSGPVTVTPGRHEVRCDLPGYTRYREPILLEHEDDRLLLTIRLTPLRLRTAIGSNLLLAGLGQHYLGHGTRGWLYNAAEAGGLLTALAGEIKRSDYRKDYLLLRGRYNQAINADDIATFSAAMDKAYSDMEDMETLRNMGLAVAGGAVLISMLDAWLSFPAVTAGAGPLPVIDQQAATDPQPAVHAALRLGF